MPFAASIPIVLRIADEEIARVMTVMLSESGYRLINNITDVTAPFMLMADALYDLEALSHEMASVLSHCQAVIWLGSAQSAIPSHVPHRVLERPFRQVDLLEVCRATMLAVHRPIKTLGEHVMYQARERLLNNEQQNMRVELTGREAEMLEAFIEAGTSGLSRETLLREVWGHVTDLETHTLETHIYRLRQKLEMVGGKIQILSEQGGYRLAF
ncbi:MAG: winged helix-turn-helix domain-containing protein [Rickettsiales bacterium]|nr:winged helix-turn-helix domain-containing protein [Rickettsiales bacterium]